MSGFKKFWSKHDHDLMVYGMTVIWVYVGDYFLSGSRLEPGWLPLLAAVAVSAFIFFVVDFLMRGRADTPDKVAGKRRNFSTRMVIAGALGLAAQSTIPALLKPLLSLSGIQL
jgi:hypothetical protein